AEPESDSSEVDGVGRDERRPPTEGILVRRLDDLLRIHASRGNGERSRRPLFPISRSVTTSTPTNPAQNIYTEFPYRETMCQGDPDAASTESLRRRARAEGDVVGEFPP